MKISISSNRWLVVLCLLMAGLIGILAPAAAKPLFGGGTAVPGGPGYVTISGVLFKPQTPTAAYSFMNTTLVNQDIYSRCFYAPLDVPDKAQINKLVVFYNDTDSTANFDISAYIVTHNLFSRTISYIANMETTFNSPPNAFDSFQYEETTQMSNPVVNLASNGYYVDVCLPPSQNVRLNAVRVDYGYSTSLPALSKEN